MKFDRNKIVALLFLASLITSSMFIQNVHAQGLAWIEPPIIYTNVCQNFAVTVVADVEIQIVMFEFLLYFDPTQMNVTNFMVMPPWILTQFDIGPNYIWVQGYDELLGPGLVPLAEIAFHCIASGTSDLSFDYVMVSDPVGTPFFLPWKGATVTQYDLYWKPLGLEDYAPSGIPDFDQKQDAWTNPVTDKWSYCGPTAIANSFWWLDSFNEPNPIPPPTINDNFPLVWSYNPGVWDDHDPLNVGPLITDLAWYMDTDGQRSGIAHNGTNVMDMARGIDQYLLDHSLIDKFYQKTVRAPDFFFIEKEVEKCEDVTLLLGFWQTDDGINYWRVGGHYVTVAGIDSAEFWIAFSDPCIDNAEAGGPGIIRPAAHGYPHDPTVHNDTLFASHDIYAALVPGPGGSPGNPNFEVNYNEYEIAEWYELINTMTGQNCPEEFEGQTGDYNPSLPVFTEVEYAVIVSPWYAKPPAEDYAISGVPDFDQRQDGWVNPYPPEGTWSYCGPVAEANSLWYLDSHFEPGETQPPAISDGFPLVTAYGEWDDHDPQNVQPLIDDLAWYMDTNGVRSGIIHCGTTVWDMQEGIEMYLADKGMDWKFYEHTVEAPFPDLIYEELLRCQDVVLLLGFWQYDPDFQTWSRVGGHYVTVVGMDLTDMYIAISDPISDNAEEGGMGSVPIPHTHLPPEPPYSTHNNASLVSHDLYLIIEDPCPGGPFSLQDYWNPEIHENFLYQNFYYDEFGEYIPGLAVHTQIEYAVIVSCETGKVAAGSENGMVYVHDFYGNLLWQWGTEAYCVSVAFDNEANYLAGGWRYGDYGELNFFDANAVTDGSWNTPLWTKYLPISESYHYAYGYESNGNESMSVDTKYNYYNEFYIVAAAHDYGLNLYDQWGTLIWQYFDEEGPETIVRISQDGNYIVCADGYSSGTLHYFSHLKDGVPGWGSGDGIPVWSFGGYSSENAVHWVAISGTGSYVAVGGWAMDYVGADVVVLLNRTGDMVWRHIGVGGEGSHLAKVDMPCHGRSVVAATEDLYNWFGCDLYYFDDGGDGWDSGDGTPVWDYWPSQEVGGPHDPDDDFYTVSISQNGDVISAGGYDGISYLYVLDKSGTVLDINEDGTTIQSVDVTFNGRYTALGTGEGYIALYDKDISDWKWVQYIGYPIRSVAISKLYPCMFPYPNHDVAVSDIIPWKTVVGQGFTCRINVTLTNQGDFTESFNVALYANATLIKTLLVNSLAQGTSTVLTFTWNTTGFALGNYTISACASVVPDEVYVADNTLIDGWIFVGIVGDVNGDKKVDLTDVLAVALAYGSLRGTDGQYWHQPPCYNCPHSPNLDIDDDGKIDLADYLWVVINYGKVGP
jgi:hypothetical protein